MQSIKASTLIIGSTADADYFSEKGELLIPRGTVITERHIDILSTRHNQHLFTKAGSEEEELDDLLSKEIKELSNIDFTESERRPFVAAPAPAESAKAHPIDIRKVRAGKAGLIELSFSAIAQSLDDSLGHPSMTDRPSGPPLKNKISQITVSERTEQYKESISGSYETALRETEWVLRQLADSKSASAYDVERIVQRFIKLFVTDRNILLNISSSKSPREDYLFHHSLNVCLLAINVAASYGYSENQVQEIGIGALLHDIGMLLIPGSIRTKRAKLTDDEWYEIQKHPILGLHLLEKLKHMPGRIPYVAYQVHERENSTGYPRQRSGLLIHRYAKMVQIADIYEALTSPRPHRPAYPPFKGMAKLIQMSRSGLISSDAVRAFVEYVSLFPVGSLVELNTRCIARVVQSNKAAVHLPIVSVLVSEQGQRLAQDKIFQLDLSKSPAARIVRALPSDFLESISLMDGF